MAGVAAFNLKKWIDEDGDEKLRTCEKCGRGEPPKGTPAAAKAS